MAAFLLDACVGGRPHVTRSGRPAPHGYDPAAFRACIGDLDHMVARYRLLPDQRFAGNCSALGAVQLRDIGTPVGNLGAMTCPLAREFTFWVQNDLRGPARRWLSSDVVRVESLGTYACRNVNGAAEGQLSEHAFANAVDIAAFVLADGRRVTIASGWQGNRNEVGFLHDVRDAACKRFGTVLSPDYNALHRDHFHFDMGRGPFCR